jgi:hypothetical protein
MNGGGVNHVGQEEEDDARNLTTIEAANNSTA